MMNFTVQRSWICAAFVLACLEMNGCSGPSSANEETCVYYESIPGSSAHPTCTVVPCLLVDCDDGDPCTTDTCRDGICSHTNNTGPCDDGNPCTTNDTCSGGTCMGTVPAACPAGCVCPYSPTNPGCNPNDPTAPCITSCDEPTGVAASLDTYVNQCFGACGAGCTYCQQYQDPTSGKAVWCCSTSDVCKEHDQCYRDYSNISCGRASCNFDCLIKHGPSACWNAWSGRGSSVSCFDATLPMDNSVPCNASQCRLSSNGSVQVGNF